MPVPVFSTGEVLTAANMNAVGLWRVTGCTVSSAGGTAATASNGVITVGSGNTSVTISNAFSSNFENYRITWTNGTMSASTAVTLKLGAVATNYYGFMAYGSYTSTAVSGVNDNASVSFTYAGGGDSGLAVVACDVFQPWVTGRTQIQSTVRYGTTYGNYVGIQDSSTSFTSFTIAPFSGTITGGQIRVYGYRN